MKEMTTRADVMMTDEERAEMESAGLSPGGAPGSPIQRPTSPKPPTAKPAPGSSAEPTASTTTATGAAFPSSGLEVSSPSSAFEKSSSPFGTSTSPGAPGTPTGSGLATPSASSSDAVGKGTEKDKKGKPKMTAEQKAKLKAIDEERRKATEERCVVFLFSSF